MPRKLRPCEVRALIQQRRDEDQRRAQARKDQHQDTGKTLTGAPLYTLPKPSKILRPAPIVYRDREFFKAIPSGDDRTEKHPQAQRRTREIPNTLVATDLAEAELAMAARIGQTMKEQNLTEEEATAYVNREAEALTRSESFKDMLAVPYNKGPLMFAKGYDPKDFGRK